MKCAGPFFLSLIITTSILSSPLVRAEDELYSIDQPTGDSDIHADQFSKKKLQKSEFDVVQQEERSKSGLISVIGGDQLTRNGILTIADKMKDELYLLGAKLYPDIKLPIIIQLIGKSGDTSQSRSMVTRIEKVEGEYQMKLYIHLASEMDNELLQYYLMELFLYERGLSGEQEVVDGERLLVKPWLIEGMLEAIKIKRGQEDKGLYQADTDYFDILSLDQLLKISEQDLDSMIGAQSVAFKALSGALVNSLLRQPNGSKNMEGFIADFATFKGEPESLFRKHFPGMNQSARSLEKWVNLEVLELGTADVTQVYSIEETDKRLESNLKLRYKNEDDIAQTVGILDFREVLELDIQIRYQAVNGAIAELKRLSYRCFPEYRPVIYEYLVILNEIAKGKGGNIEPRLAKLSDSRQRMKAAGKRVNDYLNWFYITQSNQVGADFNQYRQVSDALQKEATKAPPSDHLKDYLINTEAFFRMR